MEKEIKACVNDILQQRHKLFILELALHSGNVSNVCRTYSIPRSTFYDWKSRYDKFGSQVLLRINTQKEYTPRFNSETVN